MKLIPLNKDCDILKECGFEGALTYDNPKFHGHQKGVAICLINKETGRVENNMLSEKLGDKRRDDILKMILESKTIVKVVDEINQYEEGRLIKKQIFYLPYIVEGHSVFKPTINYDNISGATNVEYQLDIEILFVHENLNRYITVHVTTTNVSIMDSIYYMFEDDDLLKEELLLHGIEYVSSYEESDEDGCTGYNVDFYDEAGNMYHYGFPSGERLRDTVASVRLVGISMDIIDEETEPETV